MSRAAPLPVREDGLPPRREHFSGDFELESGEILPGLIQAYTLDGPPEPEGDPILLFHALTGDAQPRNWWSEVVGPGKAIDTDRRQVLCVNLLGSCYGTRWEGGGRPPITVRDMARAIQALLADLGIRRIALAAGGSLGGMVAMEWAVSWSGSVGHVVIFAAPARHSAQAIAWNHVQRLALRYGGREGLGLARRIAMISYRTGAEFEARFGRERRGDGVFQMESYLDHQAEKLQRRFDVDGYLRLIGAMDSHDVGRGRGGAAAALRPLGDKLVGVGIPGDLLYPAEEVRAWVEQAGATYREIHSVRGHDAFLLERDQVAAILETFLQPPGGET